MVDYYRRRRVWTFFPPQANQKCEAISTILRKNSAFNARLPNGENIDVKTERKDDDDA